jgi:hypothetical protein
LKGANGVGIPHVKTVTVDDRKRLRIGTTKPGQVFSIDSAPDGSIKLVPLVPKSEPPRITAKLVKQGGALIFQIPKGYKLNPEAIGRAVAEERESRS